MTPTLKTPTPGTLAAYRKEFGPAFIDTIHVFQDVNDRIRGMAGYWTAFGFKRSAWRTTLGLVEFAKATFGGGRLRRIDDGPDGEARYVVLAPQPQKSGNGYPTWIYHV